MENTLVRSLVWLDFRLALVFTVFAPLLLLFWAFKVKNQVIIRSLTIYWRVACLLAITVYLLIASLPIGFLTGWIARILMPLSLWFWEDLNEDINRNQTLLSLLYTSWRWAMVAYCAIGTLFGATFLSCGFTPLGQLSDRCQILLEAPLQYKSILHSGLSSDTLAFGAIVALIVYAICFASFVIFGLPKQGRIAFRD
ncbi:Protein of unknown function (DUF3177) [Synechococcus sp. PCC 7502]|uniref:DUF3177 family protein n=1 Tax=Synechococcus sp. PCC 7502 TaxID=1173263 RepID=UPI00029FAB36|nr:DUF3177 family protein [Synechococcus sp. PCC 7502]AFY74491.1 Protein of unknown function (DUF3177) [Synechococcus sp. PCC 7502]